MAVLLQKPSSVLSSSLFPGCRCTSSPVPRSLQALSLGNSRASLSSGIMKDIPNEGQGTLSLDVWGGWQARMGRGAGEVDLLLSSLLTSVRETVDIFACTSQGLG